MNLEGEEGEEEYEISYSYDSLINARDVSELQLSRCYDSNTTTNQYPFTYKL